MHLIILLFTFIFSVISPFVNPKTILQTPNPSSKPILVQLPYIYLLSWRESDRQFDQPDKKIDKSKNLKVWKLMLIINRLSQWRKIRWTLRTITARVNSKQEMYRILQLEGDVYLPPNSQTNNNYISEILSGTKKILLESNDV